MRGRGRRKKIGTLAILFTSPQGSERIGLGSRGCVEEKEREREREKEVSFGGKRKKRK